MSTEQTIRKQISQHPVLLYMKGIPAQPECDFSAKAVAALQATGVPFSYVNVLQAPFIREKLPKISLWPTYPQLFISGELVGGADIVEELAARGELKGMLDTAVNAAAEQV